MHFEAPQQLPSDLDVLMSLFTNNGLADRFTTPERARARNLVRKAMSEASKNQPLRSTSRYGIQNDAPFLNIPTEIELPNGSFIVNYLTTQQRYSPETPATAVLTRDPNVLREIVAASVIYTDQVDDARRLYYSLAALVNHPGTENAYFGVTLRTWESSYAPSYAGHILPSLAEQRTGFILNPTVAKSEGSMNEMSVRELEYLHIVE